jgi:hypothetical protein
MKRPAYRVRLFPRGTENRLEVRVFSSMRSWHCSAPPRKKTR